MSGEVQAAPGEAGLTLDFLVTSAAGQVWNRSGGGAFEAYNSSHYSTYTTSMTEQGVASALYLGNFPSTIPAGVYGIVAKRRAGADPAETDAVVSQGELHWDGSAVVPLSSLATAAQIAQIAPLRPARGVAIPNFLFKMVSATDSKTPLTSGVVSGMISRDGGAFGPLQSGAFTEIGKGWYRLLALTSGDLLCNTAALVLTAAGADQRDFGFVLQRTSGQ